MKAQRIQPSRSDFWPGPGELVGMVAACYARLMAKDEAEWAAERHAMEERIRLGRIKRVQTLRDAQIRARKEGRR